MGMLLRMIYEDQHKEYIILGSAYMIRNKSDVSDLLCPNNDDVKVHTSAKRGSTVSGLKQRVLTSPDDMTKMLEFIHAAIRVESTPSPLSKTHIIYQLTIECRDTSQTRRSRTPGVARQPSQHGAYLHFVELMPCRGPPVVSPVQQDVSMLRRDTKKDFGLALFEMLVAQKGGQSSRARSTTAYATPLPFDQSLLTQILEPALSGKTNILSLCTIHAKEDHHPADYLKFAACLRQLRVDPTFNPVSDDVSTLQRYRMERQLLLAKLKHTSRPKNAMDSWPR
ncbi:P-loop containing nucleoside triphosphate hydrolase protein [Gongronella butleri]|nr:P-loop containing nucleoside triphosphate hydrolase protein [Gongronella butleri]